MLVDKAHGRWLGLRSAGVSYALLLLVCCIVGCVNISSTDKRLFVKAEGLKQILRGH